MKKIVLTEEDFKAIDAYYKGEMEPGMESPYTDRFFEILDRASELERELKAYDEVEATSSNCCVITWYVKKFREQQEAEKQK